MSAKKTVGVLVALATIGGLAGVAFAGTKRENRGKGPPLSPPGPFPPIAPEPDTNDPAPPIVVPTDFPSGPDVGLPPLGPQSPGIPQFPGGGRPTGPIPPDLIPPGLIDPDTGEIDLSKIPLPKTAETHVVRSDGSDVPWLLAREKTGDPNRWPELCRANPQLAPHPEWGCVYPPPGSIINLPVSWSR